MKKIDIGFFTTQITNHEWMRAPFVLNGRELATDGHSFIFDLAKDANKKNNNSLSDRNRLSMQTMIEEVLLCFKKTKTFKRASSVMIPKSRVCELCEGLGPTKEYRNYPFNKAVF